MTFHLEDWVFSHYGHEHPRPGLERIGLALRSIKDSLQQSTITIIAGTNGKGETTHRLGQYFLSSTFCTWTSPHVLSLCERFSSETGNISELELEKWIKETHEIVKQEKFELSYYEFLFYVFCRWASSKKPAFLFLEVGLGGRLDAVNALDAQLVLLTSISRDHQEILGSRYDQILNEKLGVLRERATLISFLDLRYLQERTAAMAKKLGVIHVELEYVKPLSAYDFSQRNQFLAYAACCHLLNKPLNENSFSLDSKKLPFRGEIVSGMNEWRLFGSHNVDGMRKLIQFLHSANYNFKDSPFNAVVTSFSKRPEKDLRAMLKMLKGAQIGRVIVTAFDHPKACPREVLKELAHQEGLDFVENIADHVQGWTHQKILVAGSYYFLGQLQPLLR